MRQAARIRRRPVGEADLPQRFQGRFGEARVAPRALPKALGMPAMRLHGEQRVVEHAHGMEDARDLE